MRRPYPRFRGIIPFIFVLVSLTPAPAHAGAHVGLDFDLGAPLGQRYLRYATGLGARFGWRFDLGPIWLQPEAGASFVTFKETIIEGIIGRPLDVPRFTGGARLGLGRTGVVQPALFGHAGIGWYENKTQGPVADAGLAVDLALVPHFTFGAQLGYNVLTLGQRPGTVIMTGVGPVMAPSPYPSAVQWISAGIHGGFTF